MIDLTPEQLAEVKRILSEHAAGLGVWAFGSRVNATASPHSDLDLAIVGQKPMEWQSLERIKDAFASSGLPFLVDVLDYSSLDEGIAKQVLETHEVVQ